MRLVCVSDTHNRHDALVVPEGDVLVHAGDASMTGSPDELRRFAVWLASLPHEHKVLIAGNHDWLFQRHPIEARALFAGVTYLEGAGTEIGGRRFWGGPWQPEFLAWAFNLPRGPALAEKWAAIPAGTEVLVTHGPPNGVLDEVPRRRSGAALETERAGCEALRDAVARVRPRLHVFGHIHEGYGQERIGETLFVNASTCDAAYRPRNPPVVVEL